MIILLDKLLKKELNLTIFFEDNIESLFIVSVDENPLKVMKDTEMVFFGN